MVKILVFLSILTGIIIYPVIISSNNLLKIKKEKIKKLPNIEIIDGKYKIYNNVLEKNGTFTNFEIFTHNNYIAKNLTAYDLIKKEFYKSKKTIMNNNIITGFTVFYKNSDYKLKTTKAIYNTKNKILKGNKFVLLSKDYRGYGSNFKVDQHKNIDATNITYYIKVKKWKN